MHKMIDNSQTQHHWLFVHTEKKRTLKEKRLWLVLYFVSRLKTASTKIKINMNKEDDSIENGFGLGVKQSR